MGKLTDGEINYIKDTWESLDKKGITARALARVFVVYPWTTRLFSKLRGKFAAGDPGVQEHAEKVAKALGDTVKSINKMEEALGPLSERHQTIGVDTQNFRTFIVELALQSKGAFTSEAHKATYKFLRQVANGLS
ncbi:hemoglobin subunit beta-like [Mobula birostris]|uniref:hemoglobin subunit beta-like n=1 Tax=Mobula birostris TaxID=1983395 RepID=UPI003B283AFB